MARNRLFAVLISATFSLAPRAVFAASEMVNQLGAFAGRGGAQLSASQDPRVVIARVILFALTVVGTLFFAYIVYAGYLWMTAAGDEEKVDKGKSTIRTAVIGVIVTLSAYAITQFVTTSLLEVQNTSNIQFMGTTNEANRPPAAPGDVFGPTYPRDFQGLNYNVNVGQ